MTMIVVDVQKIPTRSFTAPRKSKIELLYMKTMYYLIIRTVPERS